MIMRFRIEGNIKVGGKKKLQPQFIEKDFKDREAAGKYSESDYCKGWKKIEIKEV